MKRTPHALLSAACAAALLTPLAASADDIVWDGTAGDGFWTNGPQNVNNTAFPTNPGVGANWTINAGTPGQIVPSNIGPGGNMIDYTYTGHDWTINNATISEDVQVKLDGGSLAINDSTVSLLPSSVNTAAQLSGLNLGQNGNPTNTTITNSTLNTSRSNVSGYSFRLFNTDTDLINATVNVNAEIGEGDLDIRNASTLSITAGSAVNVQRDFDLRNTAAVDIDATSTLTVGQGIELFGGDVSLAINGGTVNAGWIRGNSGPEDVQNLQILFDSGAITLSDPNPFRDTTDFEGQFDWNGVAGSGTITHTDLSANDTNLAGKIAQGFFSIDGTRINPSLSHTTDWTDPANIDALNAELAALAVNNKRLELTLDSGAGTQTLSLLSVLIPGDTDGDGDIDDSDLGTAFSNYTGPLPVGTGGKSAAQGDTDGDGDVDDSDLGTAFSGYTGPLGPAAVPEPTGLALLGLGGLLIARRRRAAN